MTNSVVLPAHELYQLVSVCVCVGVRKCVCVCVSVVKEKESLKAHGCILVVFSLPWPIASWLYIHLFLKATTQSSVITFYETLSEVGEQIKAPRIDDRNHSRLTHLTLWTIQ